MGTGVLEDGEGGSVLGWGQVRQRMGTGASEDGDRCFRGWGQGQCVTGWGRGWGDTGKTKRTRQIVLTDKLLCTDKCVNCTVCHHAKLFLCRTGQQPAPAATPSSQHASWRVGPSWSTSSGCAASANTAPFSRKSLPARPVRFATTWCEGRRRSRRLQTFRPAWDWERERREQEKNTQRFYIPAALTWLLGIVPATVQQCSVGHNMQF